MSNINDRMKARGIRVTRTAADAIYPDGRFHIRAPFEMRQHDLIELDADFGHDFLTPCADVARGFVLKLLGETD